MIADKAAAVSRPITKPGKIYETKNMHKTLDAKQFARLSQSDTTRNHAAGLLLKCVKDENILSIG